MSAEVGRRRGRPPRWLLATLCAYLAWLWRRRRLLRALLDVPTETFWELLAKSDRVRLRSGLSFPTVFPQLMAWCEKHRQAGLYKIYAGFFMTPFYKYYYIVCDLNVAKQILNRRSYQQFRKGRSYRISSPLVGNGLLSVEDGDDWRSMRDLASAGLKIPSMERAVETVARTTAAMMDRWRLDMQDNPGFSPDVYEEALRLTMDILGCVAFSHDFGSVGARTPEDAPLFSAFQTILTSIVARSRFYPLSKYLPTRGNRLLSESLHVLNKICRGLMDDRRVAGPMPKGDVLDSLLAVDERGAQRLSDQQVMDCMKTILFAGHDTTASALSWALHLLAVHPEWQERLRQSLAQASFAPSHAAQLPPSVDYHTLDELEDLSAVVKETLRLYPSAAFTREPCECVTVQTSAGREFEIHPGAEVFIVPNVFHTDARRFPDPKAFRPERWLNATPEMKEAFVPFSTGPRNCVGERLAMAELRVSLALLITNFQFGVDKGGEEPFQVLLLSMLPYGMKLKATPIS